MGNVKPKKGEVREHQVTTADLLSNALNIILTTRFGPWKFLAGISLIFFSTLLVLLYITPDYASQLIDKISTPLQLACIGFPLVGLILWYLQRNERIINPDQLPMVDDLYDRMAYLQKQILTRPSTFISNEEKIQMVKDLQTKLEKESFERFSESLKNQLNEEFLSKAKLKEITQHLDQNISRLSRQVTSLRREGNVNLAFGGSVALLGIYMLHSLGATNQIEALKDLPLWLMRYLPRLSLAIVVEVFAFFFLSLYKASLVEIKYFQNEITNVESKRSAIVICFLEKNVTILNEVVKNLCNVERNFILNKDQTTVELEKSRLETTAMGTIGDQFALILEKLKNK